MILKNQKIIQNQEDCNKTINLNYQRNRKNNRTKYMNKNSRTNNL
jgi:hypothetical protein